MWGRFGSGRNFPCISRITRVSCQSLASSASSQSSSETSSGQEVNLQYLSGPLDGVAVLSLDRPRAKNAIGHCLLQQLRQYLHELRHNERVRALILRSAVSGVFCTGADLKERAAMKQSEVAPFVSSARTLMSELRELPAPTLAALDGLALGGGLELALACDLRVAASGGESGGVRLGLVETRLAIIPGAGGSQMLPRLIGVSRAKRLIFSGETVDGQQALDIGLVDELAEQNSDGDAAFRRALEIAQKICKCGPIAVRLAKEAINRGTDTDLNTALAIERACYAQVIPTRDRIEGLTAFREKRTPVYSGE